MLQLTDISKAYGAARVLSDVSLCCADGEAVCVAGANAAGKTTLLHIAAGLLKPDKGAVEGSGGTGLVPQENTLLDELTVRENLSLWYAAGNCPRGALFSDDSVETLLGLREFSKRRVSRLSGGVKKRAAIAAALVGNPAFLLMDEPFAALDLQSHATIMKLLSALKAHGRGLLFTSHEPAAIARLADRVLLLRDGGIVSEISLWGGEAARVTQTIELLTNA